MKKSNKKTLVLTIVAFVLILMSLVSFTYSWIDDIKLVEFQNDNLVQNGAPLKTGTDINATVNITKNDNTIDLGNMLKTGDISFQYDDGTAEEYEEENANTPTSPTQHIKYDTENGGTVKDPKWDDAGNQKGINSKKGYFYESGNMHLSPCYSDGETFYFQRQNQTGYREGNKDDENVNYISFTAKVSSPDATTDFWFDSMPTIQGKNAGGSTVDVNSYARYAIIVDGECHVYSSSGTAKTCNSGLTGTTDVTGVRKTANYTYGDSTNKTAERGDNSNTLFTIQKGSTVNMTVKIWLEGGVGSDVTAANINLNIVSSWKYTRKLWIDDKTTGGAGESWLNNNSAKLYVTFPELLKEINSDPAQWNKAANREKGLIKELTKDTPSGKYYIEIPLVYNTEKMVLYRCNSENFNDDADTTQRSEYNVYCWNWWQTNTPNTYVDATYTLYGGSMDSTAKGYLGNDMGEVTNKGYGTWGAVEEINVYSHYGSTDYATKGENKALYIVDYTDEDSSGEKYIYEMSRADSGTSTPWKAYVPDTSSKIQFYYRNNGTTAKWGYGSWSGENPQRRPLKSTGLYSSNSTVYHFAQYYGDDKGWGYWNDADTVYLIKSSFLSSSSTVAHAYMYNSDSDKKQDYPGETLTRLKYVSGDSAGQDVSYKWDNNTADVLYTGSPRVYRYIVFNNGFGGDVGTDKTGNLNLFPGCFYQVDGNKWYGALNDVGRDASSSGDDTGGGESSDTGTDVGGGSMSGYSNPTSFVFKINGIEYPVFSNSGVTEFKVSLPLSAGDNWITVQKKEGDYPEYGNGQAGQYYVTREGVDLYLTTSNSNNFSIRAGSAGNFIVTFQYDNGNQNTIKITSILKEG